MNRETHYGRKLFTTVAFLPTDTNFANGEISIRRKDNLANLSYKEAREYLKEDYILDKITKTEYAQSLRQLRFLWRTKKLTGK